MKQYREYNSSLMTFKENESVILIDDYYDKYIVSGNGFTNYVSLVFEISNKELFSKIKDILKKMMLEQLSLLMEF